MSDGLLDPWRALAIDPSASSGRVNLVTEFYVPCLSVATTYDRAAGYFRSSLLAIVGLAFADFAIRGGKARLVCSPSLTPEDIEAMRKGKADEARVVGDAIRDELRALVARSTNVNAVRLLATLVANKTLDIRIAYRPGGSGIFHDKVGIFGEADHSQVSFVGSSNETFSAWDSSGNHEVLEVFRRWRSSDEAERVDRHSAYFESLWRGEEDGLVVKPLSEVPHEELLKWQHPAGLNGAFREIQEAWNDLEEAATPAPRRRHLQRHQLEVVEAWQSKQRGIIDHATGAGKTLSAIAIMRSWLEKGGPVVVLVPSQLLAIQWNNELDAEVADLRPALLLVGGGNAWRGRLADQTRNMPELGPRITIATLASAASEDFLREVQGGPHLMVVADEVHRVGAPTFRRVMAIDAGARLGLSATPERYGDVVGTEAIFDYFGPVLPPPFQLKDAIEAGRLVPYDYSVHTVALDDAESAAWHRLSEKIRRLAGRIGPDSSSEALPDALRMLLIRRARIVKQAAGKVGLAADILSREFQRGHAWLVYCDSQSQLEDVLGRLRTQGIDAMEYHSAMTGSKKETLEWFRDRGGVLVAIRCLDEGVDIPTVTHALILASSSNPREFIQRRGRVLRKTQGKYSASLHDVLVTLQATEGERVIDADLKRAISFATLSRNEAVRQELAMLVRYEMSDELSFEPEALTGD